MIFAKLSEKCFILIGKRSFIPLDLTESKQLWINVRTCVSINHTYISFLKILGVSRNNNTYWEMGTEYIKHYCHTQI